MHTATISFFTEFEKDSLIAKSAAVTVIFVIRLHATVEFSQSFQAKLFS